MPSHAISASPESSSRTIVREPNATVSAGRPRRSEARAESAYIITTSRITSGDELKSERVLRTRHPDGVRERPWLPVNLV
jgi:hypothetical protein